MAEREKKEGDATWEPASATEPAEPGTPRETRQKPGGRKASIHPRQDVNAEDQTGEGLKPGTELSLEESGLMKDLEQGRRRVKASREERREAAAPEDEEPDRKPE